MAARSHPAGAGAGARRPRGVVPNLSGRPDLATTYQERFRDEFWPIFVAWLVLDPWHNRRVQKGPLLMPTDRLELQAVEDRLRKEATQAFEAGLAANTTSDRYIRNSVLLAVVLLCVTIMRTFPFRSRLTMAWLRFFILVVAGFALLGLELAPTVRAAVRFANPAFERQWQQGEALAPNVWGPLANATEGLTEPYREASGGHRLVQYFDKGRMELTNDRLTNGLLATELITGQLQTGDAAFEFRLPPEIPVAGDPDNPGPTYAGLFRHAGVVFEPAQRRIGSAVQFAIGPDGAPQGLAPVVGAGPITIAAYDEPTRHNISQAFLDYRNRVGLAAVGYARSEPFQVTVRVAGQPRQVTVQAFERRFLTYTPDNPEAFRVEMGNIGQHYQRWRSQAAQPTLTTAVWAWHETKMSDDTTITANDPSKYTIQFQSDGTVNIRADCNQVGGSYTTSGSRLTIRLGPSTIVACPLGSHDEAFLRHLRDVASYTFSGGDLYLALKVDAGIMRFAAVQAVSLTAPTWRATAYNTGQGGLVSVLTNTELTAAFGANGRMGGSSGCNTVDGSYQVAGSWITIGPLATTRKSCPPTMDVQERAYLAALQAAKTRVITGDQLTLSDAGGTTQVRFTAATRR